MDIRPILGCALNLSEGRRPEVVDLVVAAAMPAAVADVSPDPDHNRTVVTLFGRPGELVDSVVRLAAAALHHIDLTEHRGAHPRLGAVDVVPFYPVYNASMDDAIVAAIECAGRLWHEFALPSFLYEEAASSIQSRALPWIRRHAFVDLVPDVGGPGPHPTGGAAVVGARGLLVAYNVDLDTADVRPARSIAAALRQSFAGRVRTLGLYLPSRATAQVSMNLLEPETTCLEEVYEAVEAEALKSGVEVLDSEIVGLVPRACFCSADEGALKLRNEPKVLEDALDRLFAD
ncbi:MAG TPA: glutamate formimidoyltransferase [Actinomycetota bacterium]|nr:glutamate formimidoyltransferase [Actinomycetota bacterium]